MISSPHDLVKLLFDQLPKDANPVVCGFTEDPHSVKGWQPQIVNGAFPRNLSKDMNLYVGNSSVYNLSEKGGYYTQGAAALHFLMVDDISVDLPLEPTYVIETSPNNYQYLYKLSTPVTDRVLATRLCNALADAAGGDTASKGMVRWTRLPFGTNSKAKYVVDGQSPRTKLKSEGWQSYEVDEIVEAFGLLLDMREPTPCGGLSAPEIEELLEHIDPDLPYSDWNTVMMAVHAAGGTFEQVVEWSQKGSSYEAKALTESKWESYSSDYDHGITARSLLKYAVDGGFEGDITLADIDSFPEWDVEDVVPAEPPTAPADEESIAFPQELLRAPTQVAQEILDYTLSRSTRPQPVLALGTMLSVLSAASRNLYQTPTGLRGNLYMVLIARTGAGKNAPLRATTEVLGSSMSNNILSRVASGAALHKKLVDHGHLLVSTDEIGLWLSSVLHSDASPHSRQIVDLMMECFTGADHVLYGKAYADSKSDLESVDNPFLTVIGATTASALFDAIDEKEIYSGMFNRFIFLQSDEVPDKTFAPKQSVPEALTQWVEETASGPLDFRNFYTPDQPYTVPIEDSAMEVLQSFDCVAESHIKESEKKAALWSRADEQAHKIAMLLAISADKDNPVVTKPLAEWAVGFMSYQVSFMSSTIASGACASAEEKDAMRLLDIIKRAKSFHSARGNQQELLDRGAMPSSLLRRKGGLDSIFHDRALKRLQMMELIRSVKIRGSASGTRKSTMCFFPE